MNATPHKTEPAGAGPRLSELYDHALGEVYGYLLRRGRSVELAEELTSATFVSAALRQATEDEVTIGWLMTVARNKLIDHWRREAVAERSLTLLEGGLPGPVDPWDQVLDADRSNPMPPSPPTYGAGSTPSSAAHSNRRHRYPHRGKHQQRHRQIQEIP